MLYIVVALKPEAQAFIDKFKTKKENLAGFSIYIESRFTLIVSGVGVQKARVATHTLLKHFNIDKNDTFLNIGICGADKSYKLSELVEIESTRYGDTIIGTGKSIDCVDVEVKTDSYNIVDMESFGFLDTLSDVSCNRFIFKVVSDHFEPHLITKDGTKKLISDKIQEIFLKVGV